MKQDYFFHFVVSRRLYFVGRSLLVVIFCLRPGLLCLAASQKRITVLVTQEYTKSNLIIETNLIQNILYIIFLEM